MARVRPSRIAKEGIGFVPSRGLADRVGFVSPGRAGGKLASFGHSVCLWLIFRHVARPSDACEAAPVGYHEGPRRLPDDACLGSLGRKGYKGKAQREG